MIRTNADTYCNLRRSLFFTSEGEDKGQHTDIPAQHMRCSILHPKTGLECFFQRMLKAPIRRIIPSAMHVGLSKTKQNAFQTRLLDQPFQDCSPAWGINHSNLYFYPRNETTVLKKLREFFSAEEPRLSEMLWVHQYHLYLENGYSIGVPHCTSLPPPCPDFRSLCT